MDLRATSGNGINRIRQLINYGEGGRGQGITSRFLAWRIEYISVLCNEKDDKFASVEASLDSKFSLEPTKFKCWWYIQVRLSSKLLNPRV
jgi:hypothetical protein